MIRYIAFLDVLGFGKFVNDHPLDEVLRKMELALQSVSIARRFGRTNSKKGNVDQKDFYFFSFSDTFVIASADDSFESFFQVLVGTSLISKYLFAQQFPVRGSLVRGEADFIPNTNHLVGRGVLRACELEKQQNWFGIMLDPEIPRQGIEGLMNNQLTKVLLVPWKIPIKCELESIVNYAINWRINLSVEGGIKSLFPASDNPKHLEKVENTLTFSKHLRDNNLAYCRVNDHEGKAVTIPWFAPCYVGEDQPGTKAHGDEY